MEFFNSAIGVLQTLVIALGAGLGIWGVINLLEGYGNDNPGANAHLERIFLSAYSLPSLGFIRILSSWAVALRYCPIFLGRYIYRNPTSNVNYGLLHWLF